VLCGGAAERGRPATSFSLVSVRDSLSGIGIFVWLVGEPLTTQLKEVASHSSQIAVEARPIPSWQ